jgi:hypothetical protein
MTAAGGCVESGSVDDDESSVEEEDLFLAFVFDDSMRSVCETRSLAKSTTLNSNGSSNTTYARINTHVAYNINRIPNKTRRSKMNLHGDFIVLQLHEPSTTKGQQ